ncbi:DUF4445 domain-containing protein [Candidatus Bathyarchaeota archaeon]|nr:MAG: DUF4445 domain-containing protein [Candidatus Bathyarchaeota archaeon]
MKRAVVVFEPDGRRIEVAIGTTVLQAAEKAGLGIRSECGGEGICGKCRVIVRNAEALNRLTEAEINLLSELEINSGFRLACQARILGNVTVMIPPESRLKLRKIQVDGLEKSVELNPAVEKIHLLLPKPTLSDVRPDLERLLDALSQVAGLGDVEIDYEVLKKLPSILRDSNWDVTVGVWGNRRIIAVEPGDTSGEYFGFAVDIGTSKIVGYLVDLRNGKTVGVGSIENPQILYGEDIITRITFATAKPRNLEILQKLVIDGINRIIHDACEKAGISRNRIYELTVAGNTAIHHFFLAIQPKYIALSPFTPAVKREVNVRARELGIKANSGAVVTVLPLVAGVVGADAVADVLSSGMHESNDLSLLIDIGTNTEIFIGNSEDIISCSCASGPAFEGVHIKHGMKAETGAIERVRIGSDYEVEYETIDDVKPIGICGSAMIDLVAEMFKRGIIDNRGKFKLQIKTPRLRKNSDGTKFVVAWSEETGTGREIVVTQKDICKIQLAKAAIYAGCSILMKRKKVRREYIDKVFIAGAFGSYINPENAKLIGLIPDVPTAKISFIGNTAVTGAKMVLISKEARKKANLISKKVRYLELAADPDFNEEFISAIFIPHKDLNRFPSVKRSKF